MLPFPHITFTGSQRNAPTMTAMPSRPRCLALLVVAASLALHVAGLSAQDPPRPPSAPRNPHTQTWHGKTFEDPWHWLREKDNPEVRAYLAAENAHTEAQTAEQRPLADALYKELLGRVQQTDLTVPTRRGGHFYYERTSEGLQYPVSCRKRAKPDGTMDDDAPEQVLLDPNVMAKGLPYLDVRVMDVSDDEQLLAYTTDTTGFRQFQLHVRDLRIGRDLTNLAQRVTSVEWSALPRTLFFTTEDPVTKRSDTLWRLELGREPQKVHAEPDALFNISLARTRDRQWLLLGSLSTDTLDWLALRADAPTKAWKPVIPRRKGHRYYVAHREDSWFITTDLDAINFRVVQVPVSNPDLAAGKEIVPHRTDAQVESFDVFQTHAVLTTKSAAVQGLRILDLATGSWRDVAFPESLYTAYGLETPDFKSRAFRVRYQSMVTPPMTLDIDLATGARRTLKTTPVRNYDPSQYRSERLWATARDGTRVPISILYKQGHPRDGSRPLLLYGYGSYGAGQPASFSAAIVSLLDRNVAFARAHVRGGDEMGQRWHRDGMLMTKKNTFHDFIDCAEHLVAGRWTSPGKLLIRGDSAGGLLMGAVVNLRPDLFAAVHANVPFVDVMNTMMDPTLPLTVQEYLEWGNPNEKAAFDYMLSYSPYDNLVRRDYPAMLVTTSLNDSQVMYWEPAKYVAKLRTLKTDSRPLLFRCKLDPAGHGGASGRYDRWKNDAFEMAWLLWQAGIRK